MSDQTPDTPPPPSLPVYIQVGDTDKIQVGTADDAAAVPDLLEAVAGQLRERGHL